MTYHQRLYKKNMTVVRMLIRLGKVGRKLLQGWFEFKVRRHKGTKALRHRGTKILRRKGIE